ncbi:MAG: HEPN domain-containing protein [Bacteroidales bacterium]
MPYTKKEYIHYRIEKAKNTLEDAKLLAKNQSWNSSVNRLYYACFYAVLALFAKFNINSQTHSGVKSQFSLHFIKSGKLDKSLGLLYNDLFDFRQKGDYGDFFEFEEKNVLKLIPLVEIFLEKIENLLNE